MMRVSERVSIARDPARKCRDGSRDEKEHERPFPRGERVAPALVNHHISSLLFPSPHRATLSASTASMGDSEFDYSSDEYGGEGKATGRKVRGGFVLW